MHTNKISSSSKMNASKMNTSPISFTFADDFPQQSSSPLRTSSRTTSSSNGSNRSKAIIAAPSSPLSSRPIVPSSSTATTPPRLPKPKSPIRETMLTRLGAASSDSSMDSTSIHSHSSNNNNNQELNSLQQRAMDEFLSAQMSGCPVNKEEKWRELVSVMKMKSQPRLRLSRSRSRSRSSRAGSIGSNRSRSYSNEETLGFIRIGNTGMVGDGTLEGDVSIASGLTSPTASPMTSPHKGSLTRVGSTSYSPFRRRAATRESSSSVGEEDTDTLPTFPSLPGGYHHEMSSTSMGTGTTSSQSLPTFPSLPDGSNRLLSTDTKEDGLFSLSPKRGSGITNNSTANTNNSDKGVFLDIVKAANIHASKESSSTWNDSLLLSSSNDDFEHYDPLALNASMQSNESSTSSIVKNLVGRYETSIHRSMSSQNNSPFFQRTNPTKNREVVVPTVGAQNNKQSRVVSASTILNDTPPKEKEVGTSGAASSSAHKSRKSRRENSLEEQVRNVLERQQSHTLDDHGINSRSSPSSSASSLPLQKPDMLSRRVKSESVASAQDILAELRCSPTSVTPTPGNCKLPKSISVGGSKSPDITTTITTSTSIKSPPRRWNSDAAVVERGALRSVSPAALAPSRRDLPRSTARLVGRKSNSSGVESKNAVAAVVEQRAGTPPSKTESEAQSSRVVSKTKNAIFPCTSPLTIGSDGSSKGDNNTPSSVKSSEVTPVAVGKPLVGLPPSKRDVPTVPSSTNITRRILPSVKEIAARFNGQMSRNTAADPNTPRFKRLAVNNYNNVSSPTNASRSIASGGSKERIDEIRASITKLKHDGVGGIGKSTSTLVRNQETGRYIIRDVDDNSFDHIMLAEMLRPSKMEINEQSPQEQLRVVQKDNSRTTTTKDAVRVESPDESAYIGDVNTVFRMPSQSSMTSSIRSDGVVDDAVRAAIDAISSTSTDDVLLNNDAEDEFFVVRGRNTQWSSFQSLTNGNKQGSLMDAFDIDPLNDWDDNGSDDEKDVGVATAAAVVIGKNNVKVNQYSSPTSVILGPNRKFMRDERQQRQKEEIIASWDPFGM